MATRNGVPIKILFADDDEDDREFFREALSEAKSSAELVTVNGGRELMQYLAQADGQLPDVIFLDVSMPIKNGKQCLQEIRSNNLLNHIPVIMFSTSAYEKDIEETFRNGANLYVSKPVFIRDEVKMLKRIFSLDWEEDLLKPHRSRFVLYAATIKSLPTPDG
jgi:CheY-like chemotaxis protein